jgi:hypothetical protein
MIASIIHHLHDILDESYDAWEGSANKGGDITQDTANLLRNTVKESTEFLNSQVLGALSVTNNAGSDQPRDFAESVLEFGDEVVEEREDRVYFRGHVSGDTVDGCNGSSNGILDRADDGVYGRDVSMGCVKESGGDTYRSG